VFEHQDAASGHGARAATAEAILDREKAKRVVCVKSCKLIMGSGKAIPAENVLRQPLRPLLGG
jgi:hypothetical protein